MTEADWLTCSNPLPMLEVLRGNASDRKLRLFACGWLKSEWNSLEDDRSRNAVAVASQFADGEVGPEILDTARVLAEAAGTSWEESGGIPNTLSEYEYILGHTMRQLAAAASKRDAWSAAYQVAERVQGPSQAALLRCIFGNAFRTDQVMPPYPLSSVATFARQIYDDRAFDRMPQLVITLEEAGCRDESILNHLRGPGPHVRGCWVLDLVLGKE